MLGKIYITGISVAFRIQSIVNNGEIGEKLCLQVEELYQLLC
jgi:hypothetical protein